MDDIEIDIDKIIVSSPQIKFGKKVSSKGSKMIENILSFGIGWPELHSPISVRKIHEEEYELIEGKKWFLISKILQLKTVRVEVLDNKERDRIEKRIEEFNRFSQDREIMIKYLMKNISADTFKKIIKNPKIMSQHHGFGTYVRNLLIDGDFNYDSIMLDNEWDGLIKEAISRKVDDAIKREIDEKGDQYNLAIDL